jgi:cellulose synthase operon protein C
MSAASCADLHPFLDGELDDARASAFRRHLGACPRCPPELEAAVLTDATAEAMLPQPARHETMEIRAPVAPAPAPDEVAARRRRRLLGSSLAVALGAAAAAALVIFQLGRSPGGEVAWMSEGSHRTIEARLGYAGAGGYRPLRRERGNGAGARGRQGREAALAELAARGDEHGLGVMFLIEGQHARALGHLEQAVPTPALLVDRAAVAIEQGDGDRALDLADRALAQQPRYPPALWNRALALELVGRTAEAALAFEELASLGEDGWSEEARQRALSLRASAR